jgi:hypothetical protein
MLRKAALLLSVVLLASSSAFGQNWARKMFTVTSHDFGSVARGAKAEFRFPVANVFGEDIHVASVRSSCGCTLTRVEKSLLKPGEKGAIVAALNTRAFYGHRGATLTVTFDRPYYAEMQMQVKAYIRPDVVIHPGSVQLGRIDHQQPAEAKVTIDYAGRGDWRILGVASSNPHLSAELVEEQRRHGRVKYSLLVRLDGETPIGYVRDYVTLTTSDRRAARVPLLVEGQVASVAMAVTVSPPSLFIGVVEPGQKVTKRLVVRSAKPFRIVAIRCTDAHFQFEVPQTDTAKSVHLVPVTFVAGETTGKITQTIRIETDLAGSEPELTAYAEVGSE